MYGANPDIFLTIDRWDYEEDLDWQILFDGYIVISEYGGIETFISINGLHKGEIWHNTDWGPEKIGNSYYDWYLNWTESLIKFLTESADFSSTVPNGKPS